MEEVLDNAVQMRIDIHCKWEANPPMYRLYVNDELFSERTYIFQAGQYLTERLFVKNDVPGKYKIRVETPSKFKFKLRNLSCHYGNVEIIDNETFRI